MLNSILTHTDTSTNTTALLVLNVSSKTKTDIHANANSNGQAIAIYVNDAFPKKMVRLQMMVRTASTDTTITVSNNGAKKCDC